jgi:hypothetical protein
VLAALGLGVAVALGPAAQTESSATPVDFRIAFIGDQGNGADAGAVLELIAAELTDVVVHSGDFDYDDDPAGWDASITNILGEDFPYFASVGNHDEREFYGSGGYQERLASRMNRLGIPWQGDLGVQSSFYYGGIFFVLTAPGVFGEGDGYHDLYIRDQLAADDSPWRVSSFHKNMKKMQVGGKNDSTGWGVYEESRRGGAIVATAHEHVYARTHLLSDIETQTVASFDNTLVLARDDPATPTDEGRSFVFVSGIAGSSIRDQDRCLPESPPYGCQGEWASIYARNQGARPGALFGVFNYQGDPDLAYFYFKDIDGKVVDSFFVESSLGPPSPDALPVARDDGPYVVAEGGTLSQEAPGVLSNDESALSAILEADATHGALSLDPDGSFTYTHDGSTTSSDSFSYRAANGFLESAKAIATIAVLPAQAATLEVPADYPSIGDALDAAESGDLILVAPGTYRENLTLTKAVTLGSWFITTGDAAYIDQTVIDGRGRAAVIEIPAQAEEGATVVGLTLQNAEDGIAPWASFQLVRNRIRFTTDGADYEDGSGGLCLYNVFEDNVDDGIDLDGAVDLVVEHNTIRNNGGDGIEIRLQPYVGPTLDYIITNNRIYGNEEDGIQLIDYDVLTDRYFEISHNAIHDNAQAGLGMMSGATTRENFEGASIEEPIEVIGNTFARNDHGLTGGDNAVVLNNVFVGHAALALKNVDGGSIAAHNLFHDNGADASGSNLDPATTYSADPLLDATLQPMSGSPAIDAGTAFFEWQGVTVLDLAPAQYRGGAPDLGAFEFVPEEGSVPGVPYPIAPFDGVRDVTLTPTLRWLGDADFYELELATTPDFTVESRVEAVMLPGPSTEHEVAVGLAHGTTYFWRVRGSGPGGRGAWSSVWAFTTLEEVTTPPAAPLLSSPAHGAAALDPAQVLAWVGAAESFDVELGTDPELSSLVVSDTLSESTLSLGADALAPGTTYHWRVRGANAVGVGPWSAVFAFTTASSPVPLMPPSNLRSTARSATSIDLEWDPSLDGLVTGYRLYRDGVSVASTVETHHMAVGLTPESPYTFEVTALDATGKESLRTGALQVETSWQRDTEIVSISLRVAAGEDDAEEATSSGGSVSLGSGSLELGQNGSKLQTVGIRFRNVDIPRGVRIEGARLQFTADRQESSGASLTIEAEASDDAAPFARVDANISDRPRTLDLVSWSPPPWAQSASGPDQRTPELASLLQEIVDRPGWSAGSAVAFILSGSGERAAESYNGDPDLSAVLEVEYFAPCLGDLDGDGSSCELDCDDGDASVHPGAPETCDGRDNDCDGSVDEGDAVDAQIWFSDLDGDGHGDPNRSTTACTQPPGWLADSSDCDDLQDSVRPGAWDLCDGLDNDCDGALIDEDFEPQPTSCGVGVCLGNVGVTSCIDGVVEDSCDPWAGSAASDTSCNRLDDDCDGGVDEDYEPVATSCGVGVCGALGALECVAGWQVDSCQPGLPEASDASCNSLDDDCDGLVDEDYVAAFTSCGVGACGEAGLLECVAGALVDSCQPGDPAVDDGWCDGVDDDCDGLVDEDYVAPATSCGVGACGEMGLLECVAGLPVDSCQPGAPSASDATCDGVDDDCDGLVDEDYASQSCVTGQAGVCAAGASACDAGSEVCDQVVWPAASDLCNGLDDDCDGAVDEEFVSQETACGLGACAAVGSTSCIAGEVSDSCEAGAPAPTDATCNGVDDNCDGAVDESYVASTTSCGVGTCGAAGLLECVSGSLVDSCEAGAPAASDATCDGLDDDCDGSADEDYLASATSCGVGTCGAAGLLECVSGSLVDSCEAGAPAASDAICDGLDDDCDGLVDEDYAAQSCVTGQPGVCGAGATVCQSGAELCEQVARATQTDAICNGLDDDCDGAADEDYVSWPTACGVGACEALGATACIAGEEVDTCESGLPASADSACDGVDDDCDGSIDEDYVPSATSCGVGVCGTTGWLECLSGALIDSCQPGAPAPDDAVCNGLDDDCDGAVDEEYAPESCGSGASGICATGTTRCESGSELCEADRLPEAEICFDGLDNDCDGTSDYPDDADCSLVSLSLAVSKEEDDAEERVSSGGSVRLKGADLYLTEDGDSLQVVGLRFRGLDVPRGARVLSAHIQFASDETSNAPTSLILEGEASDDAVPFTKVEGDVTSRPRTDAAVGWEPPPWMSGASGPDQRTPQLAEIVQEIVARPGWTPGSSMVFLISGSGHRTAHAYHGVPERAPRLELEYVIQAP